ncbi:hypothetical protein [Flagellimonas sp. CMM7]|uniref:hypothetical protein n=1 Tax=Flagellimonas sp. CMM7 TaxID=2654676 RepID=UPI0013D03457|nr:hypothetical protein [Flagellimonas sp. CMM7]UII80412.1 FixH family protein [Flagellimonas sp. CMM7]
MKTIKYFFVALMLSMAFSSCSDNNNDDSIIISENPLEDFNMLTSFKANNHSVEIYSEQQQFSVGYNELFFRIKDDVSDSYITNADVSWKPIMHMTSMMHSCPNSAVSKTKDGSVYTGYTVFQMPGNADEYWELTIEYTVEGQTYNATERIEVNAPADGKKTVNVFMGSDDTRYVLAMMPMTPEVAVNDFSAMLFKMENMMSFPAVENYKVHIDPRMPGMGNHSSPNNEDLTFDTSSNTYMGKLSLTMTGYWKINLKVENETEEILKGEDITEENESSSLFFEIEF